MALEEFKNTSGRKDEYLSCTHWNDESLQEIPKSELNDYSVS